MPTLSSFSEYLKFRRRVFIIIILIIVVFITLLARLFHLQIIEYQEYAQKSRSNHERLIRIPAERGLIYDRNFWNKKKYKDSLLVYNRSSFYIALVGYYFAGNFNYLILKKISEIIDMEIPEIRKVLNRGYLYEPTIIKDNLDFKTYQKLCEQAFPSHSVICSDRPIRVYRKGKLASHVLGYVRPLSKQEYLYFQEKNDKRFTRLSIIGKRGIEREYDDILRGETGKIKKIVDANNAVIKTEVLKEPKSGHNLVLTIDSHYQNLAEELLSGYSGAIVLMDPASGEILAMASSPDYDPNIFIGRIVQEDWDRLMHNPLHPLTNRAITGKYPPSSTFKTIAATTFLHPPYGGLYISPYHQVKCEMEYFLHEEEEKPHKCLGYHGWINLQRAIQDSCNIYFYDGAKRIGQKRLIDMAKDFGLGHKTGIDLPGEVSGFVPTPRWKKRRLKVKWFQGDTLNLAIGQGFTNITPLQNACALAGIINDGKIYRPHILKAIYSSDNKTLIKKVDPQVKFSVDLDPVKMEIIRKGLRNVVKKGTAKHVVQPRGFTMAGKTGTADFNRRKEPHSWFVGYAPYHTAKNRVVVSVLIEEGGPGGSMAAPIACAMLRGVVNKEDRVQNIRDYLIWKVKNYYYQRRLKKIKVRKKDQKAAQKIMDQLFK